MFKKTDYRQKEKSTFHFPNVILMDKLSIITVCFSNAATKKLNIEKFPQFAKKLFATTKFSQYLCMVK